MIRTESTLENIERPFVERHRLVVLVLCDVLSIDRKLSATHLIVQQQCEVLELHGDVGMVRTESFLANLERSFVQRHRLVVLALRDVVNINRKPSATHLLVQHSGEVVERLGDDVGVVRTASLLANFQRPFVERLRLVVLALRATSSVSAGSFQKRTCALNTSAKLSSNMATLEWS